MMEPDEYFIELLEENHPDAYADMHGNADYPMLHGTVKFYDVADGILIEAMIFGLPNTAPNTSAFYGFHIHEKGNCTQPFDRTGDHFNPDKAPHPNHAGDMPPLLGNHGFAYSVFYTERLSVNEIIDKSVIIHSNPDDFTSQPSGSSGTKIACGIIRQNKSQEEANL